MPYGLPAPLGVLRQMAGGPQFSDPNQAISWLDQAGNNLPISQWNALHDQAIRAQAMGMQMPGGAANPNVKAAVEMQKQNVDAMRTGQEIGQSSASFPLLQAQRQQDLINSGLTAQKTQQDTYNAGLVGQRSAQEIGQSTQSFPLSQFGALGAQESDIAKQYGTDPGSIMTTLKRRNLVRDSDTQLLREANTGEAPHAADALSYYVDPKYEPNATGLATKVPGYFKLITDQDAGMMQDMANRRIALNLSMMQQGGQQQQSPMGQQPMPQRTNTGWGIFGNEGNAGDYHTNYLQDEANAAGLTPQGYLASIVARQNAPQMQGMAQPQGAAPSQYQPYSTPPTAAQLASMHAERDNLMAQQNGAVNPNSFLATDPDQPSSTSSPAAPLRGAAAGAAFRNSLGEMTSGAADNSLNWLRTVAGKTEAAGTEFANQAAGFAGVGHDIFQDPATASQSRNNRLAALIGLAFLARQRGQQSPQEQPIMAGDGITGGYSAGLMQPAQNFLNQPSTPMPGTPSAFSPFSQTQGQWSPQQWANGLSLIPSIRNGSY